MRIMAIDFGDRRTGVAVSDISATIVGDTWVIVSDDLEHAAEEILTAASERSVGKIVIGYPKRMDGSIGFRAEKSEALAEVLRSKSEAEVILWDERLTTAGAHKILDNVGKHGKKRKKALDIIAASLILESYLGSGA